MLSLDSDIGIDNACRYLQVIAVHSYNFFLFLVNFFIKKIKTDPFGQQQQQIF